jgi:acyl-coenzyme A thioesterase PaaI-like protein
MFTDGDIAAGCLRRGDSFQIQSCHCAKRLAAALRGQYDDAVPKSDQRGPGAARRGPFWDVLEGRRDPPPAAALLGWKLAAVDPDAETIEVSFTATKQFLNPAGDVQGGFLAAMLDDTLGPALVATLGDGQWAPTIDLQVQFLRVPNKKRFWDAVVVDGVYGETFGQ